MPCPNCSVVVVAISGFPEWCPQCDWNVDPAGPASVGPRRREPLPPSGEQRTWDAARLCAYALACGVHVFTFGLAAGGLALAFLYRNYVVYGFAAASLLIAFAIRPRAARLPDNAEVLTRTAAPRLYALADAVAAELAAEPVDMIVISGEFGASYGTVGLRRRRVLTVGLPLWRTLTPPQRVALIGHELAHEVNGDPRRDPVIGSALESLAHLHSVLRYDGMVGGGGVLGLVVFVVSLISLMVMGVLRAVIRALFGILHLLTFRASRRAEYLADELTAQVASTVHAVEALDIALTVDDTMQLVVRTSATTRSPDGFWDRLDQALATLPESERERRRRVAARSHLCVDESHPPTHLRIGHLRTLPYEVPAAVFGPADETVIEAELAKVTIRVAGRLEDEARAALYR